MAAPVAVLVGVGLWKPPLPKLVRIQGKMAITGDAMRAIGELPPHDVFHRALEKMMKQMDEEQKRFYGYHEAAMGDENSGVRQVGGAGAYPSEVTGA